jgi:hypothetical protein
MLRARYLAVIAIALGGCDDESEPAPPTIEGDLVRIVQEKTGTAGVVLVDCPDDVAEGDLCDVTAPGGVKAKIRVTHLDDDDVDGELVQP